MKKSIKNDLYYFKKGITLEKFEEHEEALKMFDKVLEINPRHLDAYYNKGLALYWLGRSTEALKMFDKVLEINPQNLEGCYNKGLVLLRLNLPEKALKMFNKALEIDPKHLAAYYNKGRSFLKLNRQEKALKMFDKALEIDSRHSGALYERGNALSGLNRQEEALKMFDKALEIVPENYWIYFNKGIVLKKLKKYEEALKMFGKIHQIEPYSENVYYNEGIVLLKLNRQEEALKTLEAGLHFGISAAYCRKNIISFRNSDGPGDALKSIDKALNMVDHPQFISPYYFKGLILRKINLPEEALKMFDKVLEIKSQDIRACYNKGLVLLDLNLPEEALKMFDKVLEIKSQDTRACYNKGNALLGLNRQEEALKIFNKLLEIKSQDVVTYVVKFNILTKFNRQEEASEMYNKAIEIDREYVREYFNKDIVSMDWRHINANAGAIFEAVKDGEKLFKEMQGIWQIILLDVETTDLYNNEPRLIQLAYKNITTGKKVNQYFKPPVPISYEAMAINHITEKMVADKPIFDGSRCQFDLARTLENNILVAHNALFDINVLKNEGVKTNNYIDTLRISRHLLDSERYNLQYLRYFLRLDVKGLAHDAFGDVAVLEALFKYLKGLVIDKFSLNSNNEIFEEMMRLTQTPVLLKAFAFGKYRGMTFKEVNNLDPGYLRWLYESESQKAQFNQNEDLIYTLKKYLNILN